MNDKIIYFPGWEPLAEELPNEDDEDVLLEMDEDPLSAEQQKAKGIINSQMAFVIVGIKPTETGADIFSAVHFTNKSDISNCLDKLPSIMNRACAKKGIFPSSPQGA